MFGICESGERRWFEEMVTTSKVLASDDCGVGKAVV